MKRPVGVCAGDEVHFFHVVSLPHAEVIGGFGGVGGVDELIAAEPDPASDRAHVSFVFRSSRKPAIVVTTAAAGLSNENFA